MALLEFTDNGTTIEIEYMGSGYMLNDVDLTAFAVDLTTLQQRGDIVGFSVLQQVSPATDYVYSFTDRGGNVWTETFHFDVTPYEISGTYDRFPRKTLIEQHQLVVEHVVKMITEYEIARIEAEWP